MKDMSDYSRGWKGSSGGIRENPFFQKYDRKTTNKNKGAAKKILSGIGKFFSIIFSLIFMTFRFIFSQKGFMKKLILLGIVLILVGFVFFGLLFAYYSFTLPDPNKLSERVPVQSTKVFDRNGKLLYDIHGEEKRTLIKLDEVPTDTKEAIIAIVDKNFYKHGGISLSGIIRSALRNLFTGSKVGGSTITQQFVRNAVLSREKTYTRKFKEVVISLQLERRYSKDEILQLYLNEIPFGSNAYGIEAAAQTYFDKSSKDLTLVESAYLAAMPQAPTYYSPYGPNKKALDDRADTILQLMHEQGYITKEERNRAQNQQVVFRNFGNGILAPHFVLYVQDQLAQRYGEISLQEGGLKVTTTLDLDLQTAAEEIIKRVVEANEAKYNVNNGSLVAIDPKTGQILTMVGSRDYFNEQIDGAVNVALTLQQPGSSFKPYVYATAFKKGMSPATMLFDVTTNFGEFGGKEYIPQDYDGKNRGPISIRGALQGSLNIPAVRTLLLTGLEDSVRTAEGMGISTLKDRSKLGPSIVLGGADVKLLEHTAAYGVFANGGIKQDSVFILKVEDKDGNILEEYHPSRGKEVLDPQIAYQITNVLADDPARQYIFGRNNKLHLTNRPSAGKTGTTQDYRDAWMMGYTPSLVAGIWMGNTDNSPMKGGASGSLLPATIWNEFMQKALENKPVEDFPRPPEIAEIAVDSLSGKLPTAYTPSTKIEIFASFNAPAETDDVHIPVTVDGQSSVYTAFHSEKPDDPAWETPVREWALANGYSYPPDGSTGFNPKNDPDVTLKVALPDNIASLPWLVQIEAESAAKEIAELQLFVDGDFLASAEGKTMNYSGTAARADGRHLLTVQARTAQNTTTSKNFTLEFNLGNKAVLLKPQDNEELKFPTNLVMESNLNMDPGSVKFWRRTASGKETEIPGFVSRRQSGQIYRYTLNWADSDKPLKGSYSIYGKIGSDKSNEAIVKIN